MIVFALVMSAGLVALGIAVWVRLHSVKEQLRGWWLYADQPSGESYAIEGPMSESLAKQRASELNAAEGPWGNFFWAGR